MRKQVVLGLLAAGFCTGVTCTIVPADPNSGGYYSTTRVALDEADADMMIAVAADGTEADVSLSLLDRYGRVVDLHSEQAIEVNEEELSGPSAGGSYTTTVAAASEYTITVREPTRGVQSTVVEAPTSFEVTSPAEDGPASLSGFALNWSQAEESLEVRITLRQTFAGSTETASFGPFVDTGSRTFSASDLRDFVQGADLDITVEKTRVVTGVAGFDEGAVRVQVAAARTVSPRP